MRSLCCAIFCPGSRPLPCWRSLRRCVIFLIANTVPGDPVLAQLGDIAASNPEWSLAFRAKWGLDLPLWERYWIFLTSSGPRRSRHLDRLAASGARRHHQLRAGNHRTCDRGFLLSIVIGLPLGILAAMRRDSWIDHVARSISLIGVSAPTFWLAFIVLAIFYGELQMGARTRPARRDRFSATSRDRALSDRQHRRRRLGHVLRRSGASGPAGDRARRLDARADHPHHACAHAGGIVNRTMSASHAPRIG